jgi:nuclear transcription Y subunit beta
LRRVRSFFKACEKCKNEKRKTINGDDILFAMNTLGFENYFDILHTYLQKYR